LSIVLRFGNV